MRPLLDLKIFLVLIKSKVLSYFYWWTTFGGNTIFVPGLSLETTENWLIVASTHSPFKQSFQKSFRKKVWTSDINEYIKFTKLFGTESHHQVCKNFKISILYYGVKIKTINNILKTIKNLWPCYTISKKN